MKLFFISEARFECGKNGRIYYTDKSFGPDLWQRYLGTFSQVCVVARIQNTDTDGTGMCCAEHPQVIFVKIPFYLGMWDFMGKAIAICKTLINVAAPKNAYICRVPGILGAVLGLILRKKGIPYGVEVVGDSWDLLAPGVIKIKFRSIVRLIATFLLKTTVKHASAAIYVTREALQRRYPVGKNVFATNSSNVFLPPEAFFAPRQNRLEEQFRIVTIGSLSQMYKAPDDAISAALILKQHNIKFKWEWCGDGIWREPMQRMADQKGLHDEFVFVGTLAGAAQVRQKLRSCDLFVLPSRTEGLPRVVIEAMASGLPCIGTNVGGTVELLANECIVPPNRPHDLADQILKMIKDDTWRYNMACKNFQEADKYSIQKLQAQRDAFLCTLKSLSEK